MGISDRTVSRLVHRGYLLPQGLGVFAVGHQPSDRKHRLMFAVLACGEGSVISHHTAAEHWGISPPVATVHVSRPRSGRHFLDRLVVHRPRSLPEECTTVRDGIPVTTVERTLLDLSWYGNVRRVQRAIVAAERLELLDWKLLESEADKFHRRRGIGVLRSAMQRIHPDDVYAASELEEMMLDICREGGLPRPGVNVLIEGRIVDMIWKERRLIVELDSKAHHGNGLSFEDDRDRDGAMLEAGYRTMRVTYKMLRERPDEVLARLRSLLS